MGVYPLNTPDRTLSAGPEPAGAAAAPWSGTEVRLRLSRCAYLTNAEEASHRDGSHNRPLASQNVTQVTFRHPEKPANAALHHQPPPYFGPEVALGATALRRAARLLHPRLMVTVAGAQLVANASHASARTSAERASSACADGRWRRVCAVGRGTGALQREIGSAGVHARLRAERTKMFLNSTGV